MHKDRFLTNITTNLSTKFEQHKRQKTRKSIYNARKITEKLVSLPGRQAG